MFGIIKTEAVFLRRADIKISYGAKISIDGLIIANIILTSDKT